MSLCLIPRYLIATTLLVGSLAAGHGFSAGPADEVRAALVDLQSRVPVELHHSMRYASQYYADEKDRAGNRAALSFVLNCVSRSARLARPAVVAETDGRLLRIDLASYGLSAELWESLVASGEPYWHITTRVKLAPQGNRAGKNVRERIVLTDGGWLDLTAAAELRERTGSAGAAVRLDWLLVKLATPPFYYQAAGVNETLDGWYASLGVEKKTVIELQANHGANLFFSQVTRKTRRLSRYQGPLGGVWQTYDNFGDDPAKDPIRNPTFSAAYDASEHIAAKANGLHLFALFDAKGKRQDAVPDRLAKDDSDPHGDGRLVPMLSCVRCHVEDGLRPFADDQGRLLQAGVELLADDPHTAERLAAFYAPKKLLRDLQRDREDYAEAIRAATGGLSTREAAERTAEAFRRYEYQLVSPRAAQAELGARSLDALLASHDPVLLALARGINVQRRQFEASFAEAALLVAASEWNERKPSRQE
jgi:hypothetical protein